MSESKLPNYEEIIEKYCDADTWKREYYIVWKGKLLEPFVTWSNPDARTVSVIAANDDGVMMQYTFDEFQIANGFRSTYTSFTKPRTMVHEMHFDCEALEVKKYKHQLFTRPASNTESLERDMFWKTMRE